MDSAIGLAKDTICCLFAKIYDRVQSLRHLGDDFQKMQSRFESVRARKDDIRRDLQTRGRNALEVVRVWMEDVENTAHTIQLLTNAYNRGNRCLCGRCPDYWSMLTLSADIQQCILHIEELSKQGSFDFLNGEFGEVPPPPPSRAVPGEELVGTTPQRAQSQIEEWLADDKTRTIGVYGMGGVGKTSLLKSINNSQFVKTLFDVVILAAVSQKPDIESLQNAIARRLGLSLPADDMDERRATLYNNLRNKKYVLILDDLWDKIDLVNKLGVGVPSRGDGRKIVLSTRDQTVCDRMLADQLLELKTLSPEEGWQLFRSQAFRDGQVIPPPIENVAREIALQCNGLPLALNCLAAAVRTYGADLGRWKSVSKGMRNVDPAFYSISHSHIDAELFQRLRWSYDSLPQDLKTCFLDCAMYQNKHEMMSFTDDNSLFPTDTVISAEGELIPMWIAEGLLGGVGDGEDLFQKGRDFIHSLRDRCLIDRIDVGNIGLEVWVKVHDVLRDLAIIIGREQKTTLVRTGDGVVHFPLEKECVGCRRISLVDTKLQSLPANFKCDCLLTLVVANNNGVKEIPEGFLKNLPSLKVLDLSGTSITSLPSSLNLLKELTYLDLACTDIKELPDSIGSLTCLQFLNLSDCEELTTLPLTISELKSLRSLRLAGCENLSAIGIGISGLTCLETLTMYGSNIFVGEGSAEMETNEICFKGLANLINLREISLRVKSPITKGLLGSWINVKYLELDFSETNQENIPEDMQAMDQLEFLVLRKCNTGRMTDWISGFQSLSLVALYSCHKLTEIPELHRLPSLKFLLIQDCDGLRDLWMEGGRDEGFPALETLALSSLPSLESIVGGVLEEGVMPNLKRLMVEDCEKLKKLPLGIEKRLKDIRGSKDWWDGLTWEHDYMRNSLQHIYREW